MSLSTTSSVAIILLAAGESRRMGVPKQLLPVQGQPMVRRAAELARQATAGPVIVVLGANADQVGEALAGLDVERATNPDWQEGMGASLRHGINHLAAIAPACPAALVLLVDQPGIQAGHLSALIECHARFPEHIIASEYRGVTQPPALFPQAWFARLGSLTGDRGAKAILRDAGQEVQRVPVPALADVDTPAEYDAFIKSTAARLSEPSQAMTEIGHILELLRIRADRAAVLVTLARVEGSSYRRPGARLLWFEDGTRTGGISGGCLEEDVIAHARDVLQSRHSKVVLYNTASENDLVWGTGTGCDGNVTLVLEYIPVPRPAWLDTLATNYRAHQSTALDVRYAGDHPGTRLADAQADAPGSLPDLIAPPQRLIVCGAGDDAQPLVTMAATLGWDVIVVDARPAHATPARFPAARQLLCCPPVEAWSQLPADRAIPVVIMTHRYRDDRLHLPLALARCDRYVGLLGPRKRTERLLAELAGEGFEFTEEMKRLLHAPVGFALGATTPAGVALAILAEIQACIAQGHATPLRDRNGPIHA